MAQRPNLVTITNTSAEVLNAIRNDASQNYKDYIPYAEENAESIRGIGVTIMDYPALRNEFLDALVNRIARVLISSKMYDNPWQVFKQGRFEYGETVEEVYVDLCKVHQYDPNTAEQKVFAREIPNVRSAFHVLNYRKFYKDTIQQYDLKRAFMSMDGVTNLISGIMTAMYKSASYDEWLVMKFMLQYRMCIGGMGSVYLTAEGDGVTHEAATKAAAEAFKATSNKLTFLSPDYNIAGVYNHTEKKDQYLIMDADFDAAMDVQVLATAFNMDKAEFMGHRMLVDSFAKIDIARLNDIFNNDDTASPAVDPNFTKMKTVMGVQSDGSIPALEGVKGVIVDNEFFKVFDNEESTASLINPEGLYTNYWYHVAKTFSVSPFANAIAFSTTAKAVTSVTVTPETASVENTAGVTVQCEATVVAAGTTPKAVTWTSSAPTKATVDQRGLVTVQSGVTGGDTVTITATSVADSTKTDTCVVTIGTATVGGGS